MAGSEQPFNSAQQPIPRRTDSEGRYLLAKSSLIEHTKYNADLRPAVPGGPYQPRRYLIMAFPRGTVHGLHCPSTVGCPDDGDLSSDHAIVPASRCVVDLSLHALQLMQPTATTRVSTSESLS